MFTPEQDVCIVEHVIFQRDYDELGILELLFDDLSDILRV